MFGIAKNEDMTFDDDFVVEEGEDLRQRSIAQNKKIFLLRELAFIFSPALLLTSLSELLSVAVSILIIAAFTWVSTFILHVFAFGGFSSPSTFGLLLLAIIANMFLFALFLQWFL